MKSFTEAHLVSVGLVTATSDLTRIFVGICGRPNVPSYPYSRFMSAFWDEASTHGQTSGALFELMVASCLYDARVGTFYRHANLQGSPKVETDLLVWTREGKPWCIQMTSTLRERYRLADLQAFRVKASYQNAAFFLLTMDQFDTAKRSKKDFESLDELVYCGSAAFDSLIAQLTFSSSNECDVLELSKRTKKVVTPPKGL
jgi:hypothetical protein